FDNSTGSTTRGPTPSWATVVATASTTSADANIPVFAASTPKSAATDAIWARTNSGVTASKAWTPSVFWAVTAVTATVPHTPWASNVLRSAATPAPPPESVPAMVSATGRRVLTAAAADPNR